MNPTLAFFIFTSGEIFLIMGLLVLLISYSRTYLSGPKLRDMLQRSDGLKGRFIGALLGAVTPFCSCASVPVFLGFLKAGVPTGTAFAFLATSPIVNEAAITMLWVIFGPGLALSYGLIGVAIGMISGALVKKIPHEYLLTKDLGQARQEAELEIKTQKDRIQYAIKEVLSTYKRIWKVVLFGIGIGALLHNRIPLDLLLQIKGINGLNGILLATLIGVPLYASNVVMIPIVSSLIAGGLSMGTAMAFLMATSALSLPELIILRKALTKRTIAAFVSIITLCILFTGSLYNYLIS